MRHMEPDDRGRQCENAQTKKPIGLIVVRFQFERERGGARVPIALAIAGEDLKTVAARRDVGVVGDRPPARVDPIAIEAMQPVAKSDSVRRAEIWRRITKFE